MDSLFDVARSSAKKINIKIVESLWKSSYSEARGCWRATRFKVTLDNGECTFMRVHREWEHLEVFKELPENWVTISLFEFYKGRYDLCKERVILTNNKDGTCDVNRVDVTFKPGRLTVEGKSIRLDGLGRTHRFKPDIREGVLHSYRSVTGK